MPKRKFDESLGGDGFLRTGKNDRASRPLVEVEAARADRLAPIDEDGALARVVASASQKAAREAYTGSKRGFQAEASSARNRKTKLAVMGIPSDALSQGDPAYERCVRLAAAYRKARNRELAFSHGYVSSGVSALLATAALALAASRYMFERASSASSDQVGYILKTATSLADSARQNELAAWELCARESLTRKKVAMAEAGIPWVVGKDDETKKPGPKPKQKQSLALPPIGTPLDGWVQEATIVEEGTPKEESNGLAGNVHSGGKENSGPKAGGEGRGDQGAGEPTGVDQENQ